MGEIRVNVYGALSLSVPGTVLNTSHTLTPLRLA